MASESNMGEGQVLKKVNDSFPALLLFAAAIDTPWLGRMPVSVGIVDQRERHVA